MPSIHGNKGRENTGHIITATRNDYNLYGKGRGALETLVFIT